MTKHKKNDSELSGFTFKEQPMHLTGQTQTNKQTERQRQQQI